VYRPGERNDGEKRDDSPFHGRLGDDHLAIKDRKRWRSGEIDLLRMQSLERWFSISCRGSLGGTDASPRKILNLKESMT
jgi:hypothetical protein